MDAIQASYVAAFWDSEGTIGIWAQKKVRRPRAIYFRAGFTAANTNKELLESVHRDIGRGSIHSEKLSNANAKTCYRLTVSQREAEPILRAILPFLRAKKVQAEIAIEFLRLQKNSGRRGITQELWENQKALYLKCGPLNQRGLTIFRSKAEEIPFENERDYEYIPYHRKERPVRLCEREDCGEKHYGKGMCFKHYRKANPQIYGRKKKGITSLAEPG